MSDSQDPGVWQRVGNDTIQSFVAVTVETFLVAIYSVLMFKATWLLLRGRRCTTPSTFTWSALLVMYALALALWMVDIHNIILEVQMTLLSKSAEPLEDLYDAAISRVLQLAAVEDVLYAYMANIGDGIIIWRVYALWSEGRQSLFLLLPIACLLGSTAMSTMLTYCAARLGANVVLGSFDHPAFCRNIQTASYTVTLATTAVATVLIAYKTWEYRRIHVAAFGRLSARTRAQRIMLMLIESGVLYMLFFLVQVISSIGAVNDAIAKHHIIAFGFMGGLT
ncbi:hypothetical protein OH77DRAFT_1521795 [Trametes cingulata]|nr:hypothetical protein OH77DRAFT_1521795 [Trametes cingulata]